MAVLYADELQKNHFAHICSRSSCITLSLLLFVFVMPFVLVVRTHSKFKQCIANSHFFLVLDYWVTEQYIYEQPTITHLNEMVAILYTNSKTYYVATTKDLNELVGNSEDISPMIQVSRLLSLLLSLYVCLQIDPIDDDKDGKNEEIKVKLTLTGTETTEKVRSMVLIQSFKYGIADKVEAEFKLPITTVF